MQPLMLLLETDIWNRWRQPSRQSRLWERWAKNRAGQPVASIATTPSN